MLVYAAISAINFFVALILGVSLLSFNIRHAVHRRLAYVNLAIAMWAFGYWQWQVSITATDALFWTRFLTLGSVLIPMMFLYWVSTFLNEGHRLRYMIMLASTATVIYGIGSFTPLMVTSVTPKLGFPYWPQPGILYHTFLALHFVGLMLFGFIRLIISSKSAQGIEQARVRIVIAGMIVGFICGLTNFPLWYGIPLYPVGNFLIMIYPLTLTYAILRYRFLDIKLTLEVILTRITKVIVLVTLFLALVIIYSIVFNEPFQFFGYLIFATIAALIITFVDEYITAIVGKIIQKYIFKRTKSIAQEIRDLQEKIATALTLQELFSQIQTTLKEVIQTKEIHIIIKPTDQNLPEIASERLRSRDIYDAYNDAQEIFKNDQSIYVNEEIQGELNEQTLQPARRVQLNRISSLMDKLQVAVLVPIHHKDMPVDLLALADKKNQQSFTIQDINLLDSLRIQLAIVIENILLYEQERQFNNRLKKQVDDATKELRDAYQQLKSVDKMKDYIIDISSHELRTPATIIKSYLWMVIQGKRGPISTEQKDALQKAFQSNERLIQLISDMLDVSRIEDGRMALNQKSFDIVASLKRIVDELTIKASEKKLTLKLAPKIKKSLNFVGDQEKVEEIVINLTSNAIKYTNHGGVTVGITDTPTNIQIRVSDTGVGIPEEDMSKLFTKFYRTEQTLVHVPTAGGTGLGLFITRSLVRLMGGTIDVVSKVNKGSTFTVNLPKNTSSKE